jgi:uncharacterized protein
MNGAVRGPPTTSRMPLVPNSRGTARWNTRRSALFYTQGLRGPEPSPRVSSPRWIVDEMLGRLARYLRFVGCDTVYLRRVRDDAILTRARLEDRVVLTRDRALARCAPRSLWIPSPHIREQWLAVRSAWPETPSALRFDRCTLCNGLLAPYRPGTAPDREGDLPRPRLASGLSVWSCGACGHLYWDGSHTAQLRARLARWANGEGT